MIMFSCDTYFIFFHHQILFDFDHSYGTQCNDFVHTWNEWKENVENVLALLDGAKDFATLFNEDVEQFLMLLKLLPMRQQGRATVANRLNFNDTVDKLVVYVKVRLPFYL